MAMSAAGQTIELKPGSLRWADNSLLAELVIGGGAVLCVVPRDTIHCVPVYDDLIDREIELLKTEIFERLRPVIGAKLQLGQVAYESSAASTVYLRPTDLVRMA